ncbi:hypothetical protein LSAT2_004910 [Lamellibrachia satsuma]|nr:hypothetical protein LSAT2_004910 [Lamellibrachia satsuma]
MFPRGNRLGLFKRRKKPRHPAGPEDFPTICSDGGVWSNHHYSVKELVQTESFRFPLIVKVTHGCQDGFYDNDGATVSKNQVGRGGVVAWWRGGVMAWWRGGVVAWWRGGVVAWRRGGVAVLQIYDCGKQRRVEAVDSLGRNLSIPVDFPAQVTPTDGERAGDSLTLAEATVSLPVKVEVLGTKSDDDDKLTKHVLTGQTLLLRNVTNDVFLRASAVNKGWIDQSQVLTIPSFIGTEFTVAQGIRDVTPDEWTDYCNMFSRSVRHVNFYLVQGSPEIYILDKSKRESDTNEASYEYLLRKTTGLDDNDDGYENASNRNTTDSHVYTRIHSDNSYDDTDAPIYDTIDNG